MNQRQLECFLAVAECSSFAEAARVLHLSQPAVSQQIQALERLLSVSLFDRNKHKVELTDAGKLFLPHAIAIIKQWHAAVHEIQDNVLSGDPLTIGYSGFQQEIYFRGIFEKLHKFAPSLEHEVDIVYLSHVEACNPDMLKTFSLVISFWLPSLAQAGLRFTRLFEDTHYCVMSSGHRLSGKSSVSLTDLEGETLILPPKAGRALHLQQLETLDGAEVLDQFVTGRNIQSALTQVKLNRGIAIFPGVCIPQDAGVTAIPLSPDVPYDIGVISKAKLSDKEKLLFRCVQDGLKRISDFVY